MYSRVGAAAADDDADVVVNVELVAYALGVTTPECEAIKVLLKCSGYHKTWHDSDPLKNLRILEGNMKLHLIDFYLASQVSRQPILLLGL